MNRIIRAATLASLCTLSMVIAHLLGGGELTINWFAPCVLVFSLVMFYIKNPRDFAGPELAAILIVFQAAGHFSFGISHSDGQMSIAHLVALIVSFNLVRQFERIIERVGIYLARNFVFNFFKFPEKLVNPSIWVRRFNNSHECLKHAFERAPPTILAS